MELTLLFSFDWASFKETTRALEAEVGNCFTLFKVSGLNTYHTSNKAVCQRQTTERDLTIEITCGVFFFVFLSVNTNSDVC